MSFALASSSILNKPLLPTYRSPVWTHNAEEKESTIYSHPFSDSKTIAENIVLALNMHGEKVDAISFFNEDLNSWSVDIAFSDGRLGLLLIQSADQCATYMEALSGKIIFRKKFLENKKMLAAINDRANI